MFKNMKRIIALAGEHRNSLKKGIAFGIIESFLGVMPFGILLCFIHTLINHYLNASILLCITVSLVCIYLLQYGFHLKETSTISAIGYDMVAKKRVEVSAFLKKVPMGLFTGQSLGRILSVLTNELTQIELYAMQMVTKVVSSITIMIISIIFLAFVHPLLCLCYFAGLPIAFTINQIIQKVQKTSARRRMNAQEDLIDKVVSYAQGIETMRAYNVGSTSQNGIKKEFEKFSKNTIQKETSVIPWMQGYSFFLYIGTVLVLYVGMKLVTLGTLNITSFLLFCIASVFIYQPFEILSSYTSVFNTMGESLDRLEEIMQLKTMNEPSQNVDFPSYDVEFKNVSFSYDNIPILHNISFKAPQNTLTAIVGMSGGGKTTLMQLLMRYWDVNSGEIRIAGLPIQSYRIDTLMSTISVVFQENYLFHDTVFNNITMGKPNVSKEEVINAAKRACCHDFIQALPKGYDTLLEEGGNSVSGGERQRIAIARAILKDSPIVILDEATSGIDPINEAEIGEAIQELAKGKTVFVIAHKFSTITNAHQILVLEKGKLIEKGTHNTLLDKKGKYASLWKKQLGVDDWKIRWQD
jgi:ATP-binding cassette subfamily B protein IrtB